MKIERYLNAIKRGTNEIESLQFKWGEWFYKQDQDHPNYQMGRIENYVFVANTCNGYKLFFLEPKGIELHPYIKMECRRIFLKYWNSFQAI